MKIIKELTIVGLTFLGIAIPTLSIASSEGDTTLTGSVERVWEDGFRLNTGDRVLRVDSWDVYGDNTPENLAVGDRLTVTGEFSGLEFDAFSITDNEEQGSKGAEE
ncbi:hypothetical protein IQ255_23495 [Pleurocapsales cyanobacterium LEGE 10410]|nr:hypothetical protein [Pleurocapsales cyanobacterium LEGE 10410]